MDYSDFNSINKQNTSRNADYAETDWSYNCLISDGSNE